MSVKSALRKIEHAHFDSRASWDGSHSVVLGVRHAVVSGVPEMFALRLADALNAVVNEARRDLAELAGEGVKQETLPLED